MELSGRFWFQGFGAIRVKASMRVWVWVKPGCDGAAGPEFGGKRGGIGEDHEPNKIFPNFSLLFFSYFSHYF